MINYIWGTMVLVAVVFGAINGKIPEVTNAVMSGAEDAVAMTISLMGIMCFWTGIMKIAEDTGVTDVIARLLQPLMKVLFPNLRDPEAKKAIVMNMTANMLGMSNAATPLGLDAMEKLSKHANGKRATDEMCMFIVINTASIQLIPSTIIAMRQAAGAVSPADIIIPVWICSLCAVTVGVIAVKIFSRRQRC